MMIQQRIVGELEALNPGVVGLETTFGTGFGSDK
jgi:hypothetical protein